MSRVREVRMEAVEERRSGARSGEPEASREVRWSARRKEQVVLRLLRGESLDLLARETGQPAGAARARGPGAGGAARGGAGGGGRAGAGGGAPGGGGGAGGGGGGRGRRGGARRGGGGGQGRGGGGGLGWGAAAVSAPPPR